MSVDAHDSTSPLKYIDCCITCQDFTSTNMMLLVHKRSESNSICHASVSSRLNYTATLRLQFNNTTWYACTLTRLDTELFPQSPRHQFKYDVEFIGFPPQKQNPTKIRIQLCLQHFKGNRFNAVHWYNTT